MAIIKILRSCGQSGSSALDYVIYKHDETTREPVLDENGNRELREDFYLSGINCAPLAFPTEMKQLESIWGKNLDPVDVRMYQIIISYNPKDAKNYLLDGPRAQMLSMTLVRRCLTETLGIACTHMDGDHHSGNIHTHLFVSSIQYTDEVSASMKYPMVKAPGRKLGFSRSVVMQMRDHLAAIVEEANLHPDNLFQIAGDRISNGEYWANYRGQRQMDEENRKRREAGLEVFETRFRGRKQMLRDALRDAMLQSKSVEEFRDQLETQYQVKLTECGSYWRFGFIGDEDDYASSTLGANYFKEEICRVIEDNRRHPERMEEYLAEKMQSPETETVSHEPDITTISGCREMFRKSEGDPALAASIRKLALDMETTVPPETLLEKWTPLALYIQFIMRNQIQSLAQLDPMEKTLRGNLAFYHNRKLENNLILRNKINVHHYSEVLGRFSDRNHSNVEMPDDNMKMEDSKLLREVEDARHYFESTGTAVPVSADLAWAEKMTAQRISDQYGELEEKTGKELQSLKEVRTALEPWKERLPSEPIPADHVLEVITPRNIRSRENCLHTYLTRKQSIHSEVGSELQNPDLGLKDAFFSDRSEAETLSPAVGLGRVPCDYILRDDSGDITEKTASYRTGERKKPESSIKLEEEHYERIRKLMERRHAAADIGTAAGRAGGEGTENTSALIHQARAGIHRADAIEENSRAERDNKVAQRADRDAARKRRAAETRTGNERERGEQYEGGGHRKKQSRYRDFER